jgi:peptide/nickel transport system permease protein
MVSEGANYIFSGEWWIFLFPGLRWFSPSSASTFWADGLRDLIDPKRRT